MNGSQTNDYGESEESEEESSLESAAPNCARAVLRTFPVSFSLQRRAPT